MLNKEARTYMYDTLKQTLLVLVRHVCTFAVLRLVLKAAAKPP